MPTALSDPAEIRSARQLREILAALTTDGQPTRMTLTGADGMDHDLTLEPALADALLDMLRVASAGRGFHLIPVERDLTTQQAADLLGMSRPHVVKLLEDGEIPFTLTGRHRRIRAGDLFAYKARREAQRLGLETDED